MIYPDLPIKNGDLPIKNDDLPIKNGDDFQGKKKTISPGVCRGLPRSLASAFVQGAPAPKLFPWAAPQPRRLLQGVSPPEERKLGKENCGQNPLDNNGMIMGFYGGLMGSNGI